MVYSHTWMIGIKTCSSTKWIPFVTILYVTVIEIEEVGLERLRQTGYVIS
jgi:hypothetical protein